MFEWKDFSYGQIETKKTTGKNKPLKMKDLLKKKDRASTSDGEESHTLGSPIRKHDSSVVKGILKKEEL